MKTLILYTFHEFNKRVEYFINNGIFESEDYTFLIIINDNSNNNDNAIINLPEYVKILKRNNIGFDFGAWSDGLFNDNLYKNYDYFIFINSSCIGPFTPSYYHGNWCDIFINNITDDIKLFGTTINNFNSNINANKNLNNTSHVQSWVFCMDKLALELLIEKNIFSEIYDKTHLDVINNKEVPMSHEIIKNGWNIGSLMVYYKDVDFRFKDKQPSEYNINFLNDVAYNNRYFNSNLHPYEVIFIKDNRNINKEWLDIYLKKEILEKRIIKAIYGIDNKYIDVTDIVNSFVGTTFKISNKFFGDPAPGIIKNLIILDYDNNILINMEDNFYCKNYIINSDTKIKYINIVLTC